MVSPYLDTPSRGNPGYRRVSGIGTVDFAQTIGNSQDVGFVMPPKKTFEIDMKVKDQRMKQNPGFNLGF